MRSKKGLIWLVGLLLMGMVSGASASEAFISIGTVWSGGTGASYFNIEVPTDSVPDYSFYLTTASGSGSSLLYSGNGSHMGAFSIIPTTVNGLTTYKATGFAGTVNGFNFSSTLPQLELGSTPSFGFAIYNAVSGYASYSVTNIGNGNYTLSPSFGGTISLTTDATHSPVPIPGAAILLGSGLMGLIGIGTRKKKA